MTSCGAVTLPSDFDILRPCSSSTKPWVSTTSYGARPRVPQLSSSEEWNQPRCWSEPSRYITVSAPPSGLRLMPASAGKCFGIFQHEGVGRAGIEPDVENVVDLLPVLVGAASRGSARAAPACVPGIGAFLLEGVGDALVDRVVLQDFGRAVGLLAHEHRDRHAPGALARDHPVGPALDHAGDAVLAGGRHPARRLDLACSAMSRSVSPSQRPSIGLSIAMNHCGVLRKITGFFERQECGYWCLSRPRAMMLPASASALMTASLASPFSPLSLMTRLPSKPGACA